MKACLYLFGAGLLLFTMSSAKAVPVYGTITGTADAFGGYPQLGANTPVTGFYEYTPAFLNSGSTDWQDPTAEFYLNIAGYLFIFQGGNLNMTVGANGEPVSGSGDALWDLSLGSFAPGTGTVNMNAFGEYFVSAGVTYSTPSTTIPDTASTACLTGIAMLSLAVFGRFPSQLRKERASAR